jgi:hypothetical protein
MYKHIKITYRVYHDKWGISHKSASKSDSAESSFTHKHLGCVDPPFRSTKGLAYDMFNYA